MLFHPLIQCSEDSELCWKWTYNHPSIHSIYPPQSIHLSIHPTICYVFHVFIHRQSIHLFSPLTLQSCGIVGVHLTVYLCLSPTAQNRWSPSMFGVCLKFRPTGEFPFSTVAVAYLCYGGISWFLYGCTKWLSHLRSYLVVINEHKLTQHYIGMSHNLLITAQNEKFKRKLNQLCKVQSVFQLTQEGDDNGWSSHKCCQAVV